MTKREINQIAYDIVGVAIEVHKTLGPGLLESVYEKCMYHLLVQKGFNVKKQVAVPINFKGLELDTQLRLDLLVNDCIIVELKCVEKINPIFEAQLLTYMKLLQTPKGLLINFFTKNITKSTIPFVNEFFSELPE